MEEKRNAAQDASSAEPAQGRKKKRRPFPFALTAEEAAATGEEARQESGKRKSASPFALGEEEAAAARAAEIADARAAKGRKKDVRPEEDAAAEDGNLDAQLQFQETDCPVELPMDRESRTDSRPTPAKKRRRWYGVPVGTLVICLALVGLIFLGIQAYQYIYSRVTDDSAERAYDQYLAPVVMMDPEPFESIDAADKDKILQAAVWKSVFENVSTGTDYDDSARLVLSGELVRSNAVKLFGVNCILSPHDIDLSSSPQGAGLPENTISYDAEADAYHVPVLSNAGTYQPYTLWARTKGDVSTLRVAYCVVLDSITSNASAAGDGDAQTYRTTDGTLLSPVKYLEYEIRFDADTQLQYISAIRTVED